MSRISLHEKKSTTRNKAKWILCMDYDDPCWWRKLNHIGAKQTPVAVRQMNADEQAALEKAWRITYFAYNNISELLEDEKDRSDDQEWYAKLNELAEKEVQQ